MDKIKGSAKNKKYEYRADPKLISEKRPIIGINKKKKAIKIII